MYEFLMRGLVMTKRLIIYGKQIPSARTWGELKLVGQKVAPGQDLRLVIKLATI